MKIHWNNCFLCLNDLKPPSVSRRRKKEDNPNVTILFKYLLQTKDKKYDNLLKCILKACQSTQDSSKKGIKFPIRFCDECISSVKRVSELHMQLEALQMKLVENLKCVRETIIINSKAHGSNEVTKACLQIFEEFLVIREDQQGSKKSSQLERKRLDLLYSFQDAIFERGREMRPQIPCVFLQPISYFKPQPISYHQQQEEDDYVVDPGNCTIKIEHAAPPPLDGGELGECYSPAAPEFDDSLMDIDIDQVIGSISYSHVKEEKSTTARKLRSVKSSRIVDTTRVRRKYRKRGTVERKKVEPRKYSFVKEAIHAGKQKGGCFKCETCLYTTMRGARFEHHLRGHETTDKIHTCSHCQKKFSGKQLFDYHMTLHKGGTHFAACDFEGCPERVPVAEVPDHIRNSHNVKVFLCQSCSFASATRDKYIVHLKMHGKHNLICDICSTKLGSRDDFFSHMSEKHEVGEKLKCDADGCEETFLDPLRFLAHKHKHRNLAAFVCQECNQSFTSRSFYNVHMQLHSKRERSYNCDLCTELFVSRFALEQHKQKDHDAPKSICPYCQHEFPDYRKLLKHITKNHEGGRYPCSYCDTTFGTTTSWRRHQYTHSASSTFVCEECGKLFQTKPAWRAHLKIHNEKMYKCSYCSKSFNVYRYLKEHIYIHTGEKPWVCDHCGKAFSQQGSMTLHKRKVHNLQKEGNVTGEQSKNDDIVISEPQDYKVYGGIFPD